MLVRHGASATATNQVLFWGMPPLLLAAENGSLLALKWLVEEMGHDINVVHNAQGILAKINGSRGPDGGLTDAHVACARYARLKGARS